MKKGLVLAHFPSPYRVDVFKELAKEYDLTIYFEICRDQNRNSEWFARNSDLKFKLLEENNNYELFKNDLKNIKKYDFVLAYDYHTLKSMKMQLKAIMNRVPYFVNCDGAFIRKNKIKNMVKHFFFSRASLFFASGESAKKYFEHFGADENKIKIHNFTSLHEEDILKLPLTPLEKNKYKQELGLSENKKIVISIGQFIERKGFDVLLNSWRDLDKSCELIIIGGGELEEQYKSIIKNNKYENVNLISFKPKTEIWKYYKASDLFVLPTREDIWGLVINEAMACGLPIITTNKCIAGMELIENGKNGFVVDVDDENKLYSAMKSLLEDKSLLRSISKNNVLKIQGNTIENIGKSHIMNINNFFIGN